MGDGIDQANDGTATATASTGPSGLVRSIVHRLAGESIALPDEGPLASFAGATGWLNSDPLTPEGLRGRVVLVDFWTYTCINWLRTLPYRRAWAAKYADVGLTLVGVHTPEFGFERDLDNVKRYVREFGVEYPVAIDSDYGVWRAFSNHFWPAIYLADADGRIRYHHFGEGEYAMTEMVVQQLLMANGADVDQELVTVDPQGLEVAADWRNLGTPETYTGYLQASGFAQADVAVLEAEQIYTTPERLPRNYWGLGGGWNVRRHAAVSTEAGARIVFQFRARDVNLVMGPLARGSAIPFRVYLDGRPAEDAPGSDVGADARGVVDAQRTYQLIRQPASAGDHRFEIEFLEAGVEAYCFTFG